MNSLAPSQCCAIIPARFDSVRFPGKVLANRTGKPLIQHVYERAKQAKAVSRVIVAADDERIIRAVHAFGGEAVMTSRDHPNGTSRLAEAVANLEPPLPDVIVNVQGDEPEIEPALIDLTVQTLVDHPECPVATLATPFAKGEDSANPNIVKVVLDQKGRALYFSRALIPFDRDAGIALVGGAHPTQAARDARRATSVGDAHPTAWPLKHVGLYVYRREFLPAYGALPQTPLEQAEKLEQLRILEHGHRIAVAIGEAHFHGIDTPEQYEAFVRRVGS